MGQIDQQPRYVRLAQPGPAGVEIEVPTDHLKPNDVILVSAGEQVPVDGRIVEGHGLVDERMVRGVSGLSADNQATKSSPARSFMTARCTSRYCDKDRQHISPRWPGLPRRRRRRLAARAAPTLRGERFAEQTVPSTMALAGLGLLVGDVSTALAILRLDYASGPGMAFSLEALQAIALCVRHGILVREPEAIERLATADLLVFDDHLALERAELEVDAVEIFPGHSEDKLLCYAATAFHDLDDERAKCACVAVPGPGNHAASRRADRVRDRRVLIAR